MIIFSIQACREQAFLGLQAMHMNFLYSRTRSTAKILKYRSMQALEDNIVEISSGRFQDIIPYQAALDTEKSAMAPHIMQALTSLHQEGQLLLPQPQGLWAT